MTSGELDGKSESQKLLKDSKSSWVVQNNYSDRKNGKQKNFTIYGRNGFLKKIITSSELGLELEKLCRSET